MERFIVTYPFNSNLRNNYSEIEAESLDDAKQQARDITEGTYSTVYPYDEWSADFGETEVNLQPARKY
jgi:hypothetical protein